MAAVGTLILLRRGSAPTIYIKLQTSYLLQRRSRGGVPQPNRLVARSRRQQRAIARERDRVDDTGMALERL
jgi:hypothetical protein